MKRPPYIESFKDRFDESDQKQVSDMISDLASDIPGLDRHAVRARIMSMESGALLEFLNRLSEAMERFQSHTHTVAHP